MKPHRTDTVSLSFGTIFLLIAGWWAASQVVNLAPVRLGWLIAGALIVFGMIGLLGAIRSGRRPEPVPATVGPPVEEQQHGDLPPEMHAEIVRELLDDPAEKFHREHATSARSSAPPAPAAAIWPEPPTSSAPARPEPPTSSAAPRPEPAAPSAPVRPEPPASGAAARPEPHTD